LAFKINYAREAEGKPRLKKLARSNRNRVQFADEHPAPESSGVEDIDDMFSDEELSSPPKDDKSSENDRGEWDEDTNPDFNFDFEDLSKK
jgi:hypothetical protein